MPRSKLKDTDYEMQELEVARERMAAYVAKQPNYFKVPYPAELDSASDAENHPDNGKQGFWKVEGVRHSALVQTDSALKAIDLSSHIVGDWELCDVKYLGASLPTVFNL